MPLYSIILMQLLAAYTVLVEPFLRFNFYRILKKQLQANPKARLLFYRTQILWEWSWVVVLLVIFLPLSAPLRWLGFTLPTPLGWLILGMLSLGIGLSIVLLRRNPGAMAAMQRSLQPSALMLPSTPEERNWFTATAVTAGICEELLYRGFFMFYLHSMFPALDPIFMAIITGIIYGLSGAYQGFKGFFQTALMGFSFFILYFLSGWSILPAMVFHILVEMRKLWLWQPQDDKKKPR
jgi:membrane protease YdiL (CAAX protease family)